MSSLIEKYSWLSLTELKILQHKVDHKQISLLWFLTYLFLLHFLQEIYHLGPVYLENLENEIVITAILFKSKDDYR